MRALSARFMDDLIKTEGTLNPILTRIKKDHTLMLAIRNGYINIYYRGGNILEVKELSDGLYETWFDKEYNKFGKAIHNSPKIIKSQADAEEWINSFPDRKNIMDEFFSLHGKVEREFQQLVARENNYSSISNESEYFISDIELFDSDLGARFDIMAIRWLVRERKSGAKCRAALIEMKYSDGSLGGNAGLLKHLKDMDTLISNESHYVYLLQTMEIQFNQLDQLGLLNFNKAKNKTVVKLDAKEKPEVIFILANHNPRSTKLKTILDSPEMDAYGQSERFNLRFHVASFSGYGLHKECMFSLSEFRKLL